MAKTTVPGYTSAEAARVLGVPPARVRSFVRAGFLTPRRGRGRRLVFSFQDLVVLRAARELVAQRLPARRVKRVLRRLRQQLPRGRSLAELRIRYEGGEVVARSDQQVWNPESGQLVLDFEVAELARVAAPLAPRLVARAGDPAALGADDWYELGFELEATAPEEAASSYQQALEAEPGHADAHLNLGRLLHEDGRAADAERHYRAALAARPADSTATYNLGVSLQDQGELEQALTLYRQAVAHDPDLADAYFNMAGIHEELGNIAVAIQNLKTYIRLKGLRLARPGARRKPR